LGLVVPLPKKFFESLYQNGELSCILCSNEFSSAASFTESEVRAELKFIGDRSSILGTIITPCGKLRAKMTKMREKNLLTIARKLRCFFVGLHFP